MKNHRSYKKGISIMQRLLLPMILVIVLESVLFAVTLLYGGPYQQAVQNTYAIFDQHTASRRSDVENDMLQRWSNIEALQDAVQQAASSTLKRDGLGYGDLSVDSATTNDIFIQAAPTLLTIMRKNSVTGAFVVFQSNSDKKPALYLRDTDPVSTPADNSDLLLERAPIEVSKSLNIALDSWWSPSLDLGRMQKESVLFFTKPLDTAAANPNMTAGDLCYWSPPFHLSGESDRQVITYSLPLINENGEAYGVVGIELSTDYLRTLLPSEELGFDRNASYVLAISYDDGKTYQPVVNSGFLYSYQLGENSPISIGSALSGETVFSVENPRADGASLTASVQGITLYNTNTPFLNQQWALISLVEEQSLMAFPIQVRNVIIYTLVLSVLLGVLISTLMGRRLTRPISRLAIKVKGSTAMPVSIDKIGVREIDELTGAIESMSQRVAESSAQLSRIIQMSGLPIAAFEHRRDSGQTFFTEGFAELLCLPPDQVDQLLQITDFVGGWDQLPLLLESHSERDGTWVYRADAKGAPRWLRMKVVDAGASVLGVVVDITQEMLEMRRLAHDRDHDPLTGLLNRRAFRSMVETLLEEPEVLGISALMMMDLDNLKYINDTYGHDFGDKYICLAASALTRGTPPQTVVARMAGDEFYAFFHGYNSKQEIRQALEAFHQLMEATPVHLPDDPGFHIRASAGVAWYPDDSLSYEDLVRYADFAMYTSKHTVKGTMREFDIEAYERDHFMLEGKEDLNRLIDNALVDFDFQPIVDSHTGQVFAYEALMRSKMDMFRSPREILALARSQSKLYQIERLTMLESMKCFRRQAPSPDCMLFVNSIPNQILNEGDIEEIEENYPEMLGYLVLELTREESLDTEEYARHKLHTVQSWKARVALDDFGASSNGDSTLLDIGPDFVKIDMSIVRNVDSDPNRLQLLQNFINYAHGNNISVVAEGVETLAELRTVIENGADYVQGHLLGKPSATLEQPSQAVVRAITSLHNSHEQMPRG